MGELGLDKSNLRILVVIGTRPEALKMWPVINALRAYPEVDLKVCLTAQHRDLLDHFVSELQISVDADLNLMAHGQRLEDLSANLIPAIAEIYHRLKPSLVLVQGDTTSAILSAFVAFYGHIRVGHVEAGLRSGVRVLPFPEEMNRRLLGDLSDLHFAPTESARENLLNEGVDQDHVFVTGNTIIDTIKAFADRYPQLSEQPTILMTVHRREHHGNPIREIFAAVKNLAERHPELRIIYPVHPNPQVLNPAREILGDVSNVQLRKPMGYREFIAAMQSAWFLLSDSGGVQEEATALGKPVLLLRKETERPEGVTAGNVLPVGVESHRIIENVEMLLKDVDLRVKMSKVSKVFGQGDAGDRIARICVDFLKGDLSAEYHF